MSTRNSTTGLVIGFILGTSVGLALALLLTPKSGKQTREIVRDKATEIPTTIREQTADRKKVYKETWETRKDQPLISQEYFE